MGWNSWNAFNCDVNETKILTAANEIVNLGLKDAGYEYVNSKPPLLINHKAIRSLTFVFS